MPGGEHGIQHRGPDALVEHRLELIQCRGEEQRRRTGRRVTFLLEGRQDHPEHREEEAEPDEPGDRTPRVEPAGLLLGRNCRSCCLRKTFNCSGHQAASSLPENDLKINRSAKLAIDHREDHHHHAHGRRLSHVEAEERALVDVERQVRAGDAGSALRHHVDRVERVDQVDRAQHDPQFDEAPKVGQRQLPEELERARTVDSTGLQDVARHRLEAGEDQQHHERRPLPDQYDHHHRQRGLTDPVHRPMPTSDSTQFRMPFVGSRIVVFQISAAATGVTRNGVISSVRTTPRPRNARSSSNASNRPRNAEINTTTDDQDDGVEAHPPELAVLRDRDVVLQSDELAGAGTNQIPRQRRVVQREQERDLRDDDHEDQRRQQRSPPAPPFGAAHAGVLGFPDLADPFGHCLLTGVGRGISGYGHHFSWYVRPTTSAYCCAWASASSTDFCPAIAALIC